MKKKAFSRGIQNVNDPRDIEKGDKTGKKRQDSFRVTKPLSIEEGPLSLGFKGKTNSEFNLCWARVAR